MHTIPDNNYCVQIYKLISVKSLSYLSEFYFAQKAPEKITSQRHSDGTLKRQERKQQLIM